MADVLITAFQCLVVYTHDLPVQTNATAVSHTSWESTRKDNSYFCSSYNALFWPQKMNVLIVILRYEKRACEYAYVPVCVCMCVCVCVCVCVRACVRARARVRVRVRERVRVSE